MILINPQIYKVYVTFTRTHEKLFTNVFLPSYKDDFPIEIRLNKQNGGPWHSAEYLSATKEKLKLIADLIDENPGKIIIVSDVDIMFYRPIEESLKKIIYKKDLIFSTELDNDWRPNTGFTVLKCNEKNKNFYANVIKSADLHPKLDDQELITQMLSKNKNISYGLLPKKFWNDTIGGEIPSDVVFHHANHCNRILTVNGLKVPFPKPGNNIDRKLEHLLNVKSMYDADDKN